MDKILNSEENEILSDYLKRIALNYKISINFLELLNLIKAAKALHWNNLNIGLALGIRTAITTMYKLQLNRNDKEFKKAEVWGSFCFAQGVEVITGCYHLRNQLIFHRSIKRNSILKVWGKDKMIKIILKPKEYKNYKDAFNCEDSEIFKSIEINELS